MSTMSTLSLAEKFAERFELRRGNGRWAGRCPRCGGSAQSTRFVLHEDGGFKCYGGCDYRGDIITLLRDHDQLCCPDAHDAAGLPCRATTCPVRGTCRLGDGSGRDGTRRHRTSLTVPRQAPGKTLPRGTGKGPVAGRWTVWAMSLVDQAHQELLARPEELAWLAARGIDREAVERFALGWLRHDAKVGRADLGLGPRPDGKTTLWLPGGLLIPTWSTDGLLHRLRVRRTPESRARFLPELKYVWLDGSGNEPLLIPPSSGRSRGVVVVEAELDAMACAAAHPDVTALALGSVNSPITPGAAAVLTAAPRILVALDAGQAGLADPGQAVSRLWLRQYRQAEYWPVPREKDPGDLARAGGNLHQWLESGLAPAVSPVIMAADHESGLCPVSITKGEGADKEREMILRAPAEQSTAVSATPGNAANDAVMHLSLTDGRKISVVRERAQWNAALAAGGTLVFSANELERIKAAQSACVDAAPGMAKTILDGVMMVKEVFPGSYVRYGGPCVRR